MTDEELRYILSVKEYSKNIRNELTSSPLLQVITKKIPGTNVYAIADMLDWMVAFIESQIGWKLTTESVEHYIATHAKRRPYK